MSKKSLFLNIQPFNGDPKFVKFFFQQLQSLKELNELDDKQIVAIFTNKLEGSALEFYIDTPSVQNAKTLAELKAAFVEYFTSTDIVNSLKTLDNLQLKDGEKFKQFASRLDVAVRNVYPGVDDSSLRKIMFMTFLRLAPQYIKTKILEEGISDFPTAIARADVLKNIHYPNSSSPALENDSAVVFHASNQHNSVPIDHSSSSNDFVPPHKSKLSQQPIRRPTQRFANKNERSHQWHKTNRNNHWHNNFKHRQTNFKRYDNCRFCGKFGHYMKDCRQFISLMKNSHDQKSSSKQYNQSSGSNHNENLNGQRR